MTGMDVHDGRSTPYGSHLSAARPRKMRWPSGKGRRDGDEGMEMETEYSDRILLLDQYYLLSTNSFQTGLE